MKKIILFIGCLLFSLLFTSCDKNEVVGIIISSENNVSNIAVGKTLQLTASAYPTGDIINVDWDSLDETIATVDNNGLVCGVNIGNTKITATSKENPKLTQSFAIIVEYANVEIIKPESITINNANGTTCTAGEAIKLSAVVLPEGASQSVTWTSSNESIATVSRGTVSTYKAGEVVVTATCKNNPEVFASVTITVEAPIKGEVPAEWVNMNFSTHDDFVTCEDDTKIKIKGVVTHVTPIKDNLINYYIQNGVDGYYVYEQDAILNPVEVGKVYEVGGYKKYYRGLNEVVNVAYCIEISENIDFTYIDLSDKNVSSLTDMKIYQGSYVTGKAKYVSGSVNTTKAFSLTVSINNTNTTLRVDPSNMSSAEFEAICNKLKTIVSGAEIAFRGFMTAFGYGTPSNQIQIVKSSDLELDEASDSDILNAGAQKLIIDEYVGYSKNSIELPLTITGFDGITVSWKSNSNLIDLTTGTVTHGEANEVVTLTATLTLNSTSITKDFTITIAAADNNTYETLVTFDLEDAAPANQYGCSETKPGYGEGNVSLGTPQYTWMLRNALIGNSSSDKYEGTMGIRAKAGSSASDTARIEILTAGEYNVVEFAAAVYGNHQLGTKIRVEYTTDDGTTWTASETIVTLNSYSLETFRVTLPEGVKRVAIVVVENSGKTVNIDSIKLMK